MTYEELLKERRRELAFESQTWFDTQRYRYRVGDAKALEWLNNGFGTGINRCAMYIPNGNLDKTQENDPANYKMVSSTDDGAMYNPIMITAGAFQAPVPAAVTSSSPMMGLDPVDYYAE